MITRQQFVQVCDDIITNVRAKLTIANQKSGYLQYHGAIKHGYFQDVRDYKRSYQQAYGYSPFFVHDITEHVGMGHCNELANYLAVELYHQLRARGVDATIRIVESQTADHVYCWVQVLLDGEHRYSMWEVDAWDPRVIDISLRPDGSIKNADSMIYGKRPQRVALLDTTKRYDESVFDSFSKIPRAIQGRPRCATPERKVLKKHWWLYSDYTIQRGREKGALPARQEPLAYAQQRSGWQ